MNLDMAVGTLGCRRESRMKSGDFHVAGVAEIRHVLVDQHVPVDGTVRLVAGGTSFDAHGEVLEAGGPAALRTAYDWLLAG